MKNIHIEPTSKTPLFILRSGYIRISGRSIPQNSKQLYKVCFDWVEQYIKEPAKETIVDLYFEYIDTSSTRCLVDLLVLLVQLNQNSDNKIIINWYYENDDNDAYDLGAYIQAHMKVPVNIISIEEGEDITEN